MSLRVRAYVEQDADAWDAFCRAAFQATFLHSRRFLSYHGARFEDHSVVLELQGRWVGVFPAALHPDDDACIVSHPGLTYGGVLHQGMLKGKKMHEAFDAMRDFYAGQRRKKLIYKAVPAMYCKTPAQDDLYALFALGAARTRCDLSSTIDLQYRQPVSERRRRSFRKAIKAGVVIEEGSELLAELWDVVTGNLQRKHDTVPVHTLADIALLAQRFPDNIRCVCAMLDNAVAAGVVLFLTDTVAHAQYIAASEAGYAVSALDAVFEHCIDTASREHRRWFDFGISTERNGTVLNESLYLFKSEFGGGGMVHEFFEWNLGDFRE